MPQRFIPFFLIWIFTFTAQWISAQQMTGSASGNGIHPYPENPWYWQYRGKPMVLIGGSDEDNLFQWSGNQLTSHLDLLQKSGGNYVRNTMSDRDEGNTYAFERRGDKYDLNHWNEAYWRKLAFFLDETQKRGIIVQLTLWDHFDISGQQVWEKHPWNPKNNVNLGSETWDDDRGFYATVDENNKMGLEYQQKYIDKLLENSVRYDHVLYNINNESSESVAWENYWASYIKEAAEKIGKKAYVTTLQFDPSNAVRHVMTYPDLFDFVDISQNNQDSRGGRGQAHWDNLMNLRTKIASFRPMPMNNVKVYGALDGKNYSAGTESEAINRFWRNIFGGCASSRFHRPAVPDGWGSGLNKRVQVNLKAMQMLLEEMDLFSSIPHNDLIQPVVDVPGTMEAYVSAKIGSHYAIFFPQGRYRIKLDPWIYANKLQLRWLDIENLSWSAPEEVKVAWEGGMNDWGSRGSVSLETPGNRSYVAFLEVIDL